MHFYMYHLSNAAKFNIFNNSLSCQHEHLKVIFVPKVFTDRCPGRDLILLALLDCKNKLLRHPNKEKALSE